MATSLGARSFDDPTAVPLKVRDHHGANQHAQYITPDQAAAASVSSVASAITNQTASAANSSRRGWLAYNNSSAVCYIKFGATASSSSFTVALDAGGYYEMPQPIYLGQIDVIWATANGALLVTELT